jgi:hypothetical protein
MAGTRVLPGFCSPRLSRLEDLLRVIDITPPILFVDSAAATGRAETTLGAAAMSSNQPTGPGFYPNRALEWILRAGNSAPAGGEPGL